ncbi:hypothetical protein PR202_gb27022 [Eleusine coracana subsp. coracana]|uniref:DUF1677 family protein n=1 Tax=Eleusine coracana subsp. coracana TaxID=191504 RepID=A0AAV5FTG6_ELECO|nr:hypothetical protein QOZ80_1BG0051500 [Eleusine coracana subsp. coracana]GJN38016.1 hypothetical protein PR202_gb27022 [Eleusine coracana subsp. coracana]
MAPNGDAAVAAAPAPAAPTKHVARRQKPRRISMEGLQRAMSDLALELARDRKQSSSTADAATTNNNTNNKQKQLPSITEQQQQQVENARCECCGMQEECTPAYVRRVRDRYCGRWVCGLCAAAVSGEAETRHGGRTEEALAAHMAVCGRFNRVGRANPVLMQTEAMREILRKRSRSNSPRVHVGPGGLTRSTSCIPAITKDFN